MARRSNVVVVVGVLLLVLSGSSLYFLSLTSTELPFEQRMDSEHEDEHRRHEDAALHGRGERNSFEQAFIDRGNNIIEKNDNNNNNNKKKNSNGQQMGAQPQNLDQRENIAQSKLAKENAMGFYHKVDGHWPTLWRKAPVDPTAPKISWKDHPPHEELSYNGPKDETQRHSFNERASNAVVSNRPVPDVRHPACKAVVYDAELPTTSVILCFHNEARSTLLRTIRSVVDRTPAHLLAEILLIDDHSDWVVEEEIAQMEKVKVVRNDKREGLIRSRVRGAEEAKGDVLTYLDSHCEVNVDWMQPLLQRIKEDKSNVVTPIIDVIDDGNFNYIASPMVRGGMDWGLTFKWFPVPNMHLLGPTAPILSPTMAGGLFAIDRDYFFEIGSYDMEMDIWGGENLEMSFRIWQCGGRIDIMPCSRVGHVFRKRHPYTFPGKGAGHTFMKNSARAAEVWMDDYKALFYKARNLPHGHEVGDLTERMAFKQALHCKPFSWYLEHVYPEMRIPSLKKLAHGELKNEGTSMCMDSMGAKDGGHIGVFQCHHQGGNQLVSLGEKKDLQIGGLCIDANGFGPKARVSVRSCDDVNRVRSQEWEYNASFQLTNQGHCLTANEERQIVLDTCSHDRRQQKWHFQFYDPEFRKDKPWLL